MTQPTGVLFSDPYVKPLSINGQFQAGCYLFFYQTQTTTPANVYADGFLTAPLSQTPGANPPSCTAGSDGRFQPIYMDPAVIYRVQLYNSIGVKLEDTDPYVPTPVPNAIVALESTVATLASEISTLTAQITALQSAIAWSTITGVPAPLVSLGASTPPGTGTTFWRDDGTWAAPNSTGASVTVSAPTDVSGIASSFTTIIASLPVNASHTYAMIFEGDIVSAGAGTLNTQMKSDQGGVLTQVGGALGFILQTVSGTYQQTYQNAATPGITNPMYSGQDNYCRLFGRFTVPPGTTSVSFQIKTPAGTLTAKAGSYITLTQIA